jgi:hypothetical protein
VSRAGALTVALALLASLGCKKDEPAASSPESGPKVIVEEPGEEPEPAGEQLGAETGAGAEGAGEEQSFGRTEIVATDVPCQSDADCRRSQCCHATSCTSVADAPDCSGVMCTADCQAGTMDCNGGCLCQGGKCAAKLWWAPGG